MTFNIYHIKFMYKKHSFKVFLNTHLVKKLKKKGMDFKKFSVNAVEVFFKYYC